MYYYYHVVVQRASCHGTTILTSDCTIVTSGHHGSIRTTFVSKNNTIWQNNSITQKICNMKYTWLQVLLLPPSGYSIRGTDNLAMYEVYNENPTDMFLGILLWLTHIRI